MPTHHPSKTTATGARSMAANQGTKTSQEHGYILQSKVMVQFARLSIVMFTAFSS